MFQMGEYVTVHIKGVPRAFMGKCWSVVSPLSSGGSEGGVVVQV